jgi:hypothetical protein
MLLKPSTDAAECLEHMSACELHAEGVSDPAAAQFFLDLAAEWRRIAATFLYFESVDRFAKRPRG